MSQSGSEQSPGAGPLLSATASADAGLPPIGYIAIGWLVASIGSIMFLVGVIAQGVKVGNRHSQRVTLQGDR